MRQDALTRAVDLGVRLAAAVCGLSFAAFCMLTLAQVVNRYAIGLELYWSEEVVILLFVWAVMMGLPVALWWRQEIVVDLLPTQQGWRRQVQVAATELCSLGFLLLLTLSGWQLMQRAGQATSPALELPRWIFFACIPAGAGLSALVLLGRWWRDGAHPQPISDADHVVDAHD